MLCWESIDISNIVSELSMHISNIFLNTFIEDERAKTYMIFKLVKLNKI